MSVFKLLRIMRTIHTIFSSPRTVNQMQEPNLSKTVLYMIHVQKPGWNTLCGLALSFCGSQGNVPTMHPGK